MRTLLMLVGCFLAVEAKKGKPDTYGYNSVTAVFFPEEAGTNVLCRALDCPDGQLCVVYHDERAVCMTEKSWKKLMTSKRADSQRKKPGKLDKTAPSFKNGCKPCPVVHPVFVCGTDNVTYSSECRLKFKNCEDSTSVNVACQGRCPCPAANKSITVPLIGPENSPSTMNSDANGKKDRSRKTLMKQKAFDSSGFETDSRNHVGVNDNGKGKKECAKKEMRELRRRLVAWFWVIFRQKHPEAEQDPMTLTDNPVCSRGNNPGILSWMFSFFDTDKDLSLTLNELFDMEADKYEHCVNPFLAHCDSNDDLEISGQEWCRCLQKHHSNK